MNRGDPDRRGELDDQHLNVQASSNGMYLINNGPGPKVGLDNASMEIAISSLCKLGKIMLASTKYVKQCLIMRCQVEIMSLRDSKIPWLTSTVHSGMDL